MEAFAINYTINRCVEPGFTSNQTAEWQGDLEDPCSTTEPFEDMDFTSIFAEWFSESNFYNFTNSKCKLNLHNKSNCSTCWDFFQVQKDCFHLSNKKINFQLFNKDAVWVSCAAVRCYSFYLSGTCRSRKDMFTCVYSPAYPTGYNQSYGTLIFVTPTLCPLNLKSNMTMKQLEYQCALRWYEWIKFVIQIESKRRIQASNSR